MGWVGGVRMLRRYSRTDPTIQPLSIKNLDQICTIQHAFHAFQIHQTFVLSSCLSLLCLTLPCLQLKRQLLGEELLPWEGDRLTADTKRRLGAIRAPVLRMLCRDPVHRASCKDVAAALRAVFSGASTADIHDGGIHALPR